MKLTPQKPQHVQFARTPTRNLTPVAEQRETRFITQMIAGMSLDEELGQMMMVEFSGTSMNADLQYMLVKEHAGGTILYASNVQTTDQVAALDAASEGLAKIPLLISVDQEGGNVNPLQPITGDRPSAQSIGATGDPNMAQRQGVSDGQMLKKLGINVNLAPVVDVQSLTNDQFDASSMAGFEERMYGSTPQTVSAFAGAYLTGLQAQGVIGCLEHWPGLGGDGIDPEDALPVLKQSRTDLNTIDFAPYKTLLARGNVDMILSTHEVVPAYDPNLPASLSPTMIDQVLRHDLGFQGVVITDGLYMGALNHWAVPQAAVLAILAGNDIILGPWTHTQLQAVLDALNAAVASGQITRARIALSVQRILALKITYGLLQIPAQF
jgi:beta-N-acetylhexosaminidase